MRSTVATGTQIRRAAVPRPAQDGVEPDRDEDHLDAVVLITDRGIQHTRNEDAGAAGTVAAAPGTRAVAAVVCDGVSTSSEGQDAARAASAAGVDAMVSALAASRDLTTVMMAGLTDAALAAANAGSGGDDSLPASSCTYTAAVVVSIGDEVHIAVANIGDSRVYWLPDSPAQPQRLTVDDTLAQDLISGGIPADSPVVERGAHTLTKWFGADADQPLFDESDVSTMTTADSGVLLLCSDGLHNYLPEAADIAQFVAGAAPTDAARALVDYAISAGGHDNITVIVIPVGGSFVEPHGV
ncbi:PP2C family protein-serine/threonine phosphatase [Mycolicibacterium rhodesiae]|uniref:PP2C family protein-serine/threonine phosphatase n=1 Tax=Mycolicibacterium rhodesiae TaxID=36814 RepID=UPI0020A647FE|nr:PP2C family protein-serine/threonine phosphatase [Mycolicibacterium rhodesiae]